MTAQISVCQDITAPADQVFGMVSDLTRMGEWSPENEGVTWRGVSGPALGARFRGTNRNGKRKWATAGRISKLEAGRVFAFHISALGLPISEWRYEFESTPTGCRVTETWTDERGRSAKALGKPVSGVTDRAEHNRSTMKETLARLKAAAERQP